MYDCVFLNKKSLHHISKLNNTRETFNKFNEDFLEYYTNLNFAKQLLLRKRVRLLKHNDEYIGYIWYSKNNNESFVINSMNVVSEENTLLKYKAMIDSIKFRSTLDYNCERNSYNYEILSDLGFLKREGTYLMHANVSAHLYSTLHENINFEILQKGKHENHRCKIQNEVFRNDTRTPLTIDDMFFDEVQDYYYDKGAILLKKANEYIGYGQIIIIDKMPTIVNLGILDKYRGNGYGKILMIHLMSILKENGFSEVELKVSSDNITALTLYGSLGFTLKKEMHRWEYKK